MYKEGRLSEYAQKWQLRQRKKEEWPFGVSGEELKIKFYLENCSLGDSTSGSSETLLQTGSGRRSRYKILVKDKFSAIK